MSDPAPQVLVVGAGPTGLLLAAELERRDVPCLLIDELVAELERHVGPTVDAVVGLSTRPTGPRVGRIDEPVATQLGVAVVTVLGVRPDRYIGLRDDSADPGAVEAYLNALVA